MSTIIPKTLAELPRVVDHTPPGTQFYVKEITTLEQWDRGVPHLPHNRVWCGFNSFNIPAPDSDRALLSLQGAGDLLVLSQFIHDIGDLGYVTAYTDRVGILGNTLSTLPIRRHGPTEIRFCQIRHMYSHVSNHPAALQFLMRDAIYSGWDHYDWFGLMLGIRPGEKWVHVDWDDVDSPVLHGPVVAVHSKASTDDRSLPWLESLLEDIPHIVLGDGSMSYHQTYRLLRNPLVSAVIAVDSVVLHLAAVARDNLPVLGVYTATPTTWSGPRRSGMDVIHIDKSDTKGVESWLKRVLGLKNR